MHLTAPLLQAERETARTILCAQGEATAALAAIASRNRAHLPEAPLVDAGAAAAAQRGLADVLSNARLRRRFLLVLAIWCTAFMVRCLTSVESLRAGELRGAAWCGAHNSFFDYQ